MKKLLTPILLLLIFTIQSFSQETLREYKKIVEYTEYQYTHYSIPLGSNLDSLDNMDIAEALPYSAIIKHKLMIDQFNRLTIENKYMDGPTGLSIYHDLSKLESSPNEIKMFNKDNQPIPYNSDSFISRNPQVPIDVEHYNHLGFYQNITSPSASDIEALNDSGMNCYISEDGKTYMSGDGINIISSKPENMVELRYFIGSRIDRVLAKYFLDIGNNRALLSKTIEKTYRLLSKNMIMEIATVSLFSDLKIVENGQIIYYQTNQDDNSSTMQLKSQAKISQFQPIQKIVRNLEIISNNNYYIEVSLPNLTEGIATLVMLDMSGKLLQQIDVSNLNSVKMQLSDIPQGTYILHFYDKLGRLSKQFINY
ncbi:MAG: T9SS type A sorting domain-containing protein [Saprospiraceae bacterium]